MYFQFVLINYLFGNTFGLNVRYEDAFANFGVSTFDDHDAQTRGALKIRPSK